MEAEIFKERLVDGFIAGISDPATDLFTRADALAMTFEGKTPEEIAVELRNRMAEQAAAAQAEQAGAEALVGAPAPAEVSAPADEGTPLPPLPGRTF